MKTLAIIILTTLLTACGSGQIDTVTASDVAIQPQPDTIAIPSRIVTTIATPEPDIITQPAPIAPVCDATTYVPCGGDPLPEPPTICNPNTDASCIIPDGMEYCDIWSYNACSYPAWIPARLK